MIRYLVTLALVAGVVQSRPQSSAHVKFESPLQTYSHGVHLPAGRHGGYQPAVEPALPREYLLDRRSRYIQSNSLYYPKANSLPSNPEMMFPQGVFLPPDHQLQYIDVEDTTVDPLLLTGEEARVAVANLFSRGHLYYDQIPHVRALQRHEDERRRNGLSTHILSSNRPESPFYRGGEPEKRRRSSFRSY